MEPQKFRSIAADPETHELLRRVAESEQRTMAVVLRRALEAYAERSREYQESLSATR